MLSSGGIAEVILHHGAVDMDKPRGARAHLDPGGGLVERHVETL